MQQFTSSGQVPPPSVLRAGTLKQVRTQIATTSVNMEILWWLLWLPLLCKEELARMLDQPSSSTYEDLALLEHFQLLEHVVFQEAGESHRRRYYVTDTGLYLFGERCVPSCQPEQLARAYPLSEEDVLATLLHPNTHTALTTFVSRMVADGRSQGYQIQEFEHPYHYAYSLETSTSHRSFFANARIMLLHQQKTGGAGSMSMRPFHHSSSHQYPLCLLIETGESLDIRLKEDREMLQTLFKAYEAPHSSFPLPLLVTTRERLAPWSIQLQQLREQRRSPLPIGGVTTLDRLKEGIYAPIWYSFEQLAQASILDSHQRLYLHALPQSISLMQLFERDHHRNQSMRQVRQTEQQTRRTLQTEEGREQRRKSAFTRLDDETLLPVYVRGGFQARARQLQAADLAPERVRDMRTREAVSTLASLSLALTPIEKDMLALLARHPLLSRIDLASLLTPNAPTSDTIRRHINTLLALGLVQTHLWREGRTSVERTRYQLTETALRFLAARSNIAPGYYLVRQGLHSWEQRGASGLLLQLSHTVGVYRCILDVLRIARETGMLMILRWKSAREAVRWYTHETGAIMQLRPDSELLYCLSEDSPQNPRSLLTTAPLTIFLEYDRATEKKRDYRAKFDSYLDYWNTTGKKPPLILVVTQNEKAIQAIQESVLSVSKHLDVKVILEEQLLLSLVLEGNKYAS